jgi:hypothetical protein
MRILLFVMGLMLCLFSKSMRFFKNKKWSIDVCVMRRYFHRGVIPAKAEALHNSEVGQFLFACCIRENGFLLSRE